MGLPNITTTPLPDPTIPPVTPPPEANPTDPPETNPEATPPLPLPEDPIPASPPDPIDPTRISEVTDSTKLMSRKDKIVQKIMQGKEIAGDFLNEVVKTARQVNLTSVAFAALGIAGAVVLTATIVALFAMVPAAIGPTVLIGLATLLPAVGISASMTYFALPREQPIDPAVKAKDHEAIDNTNSLEERALSCMRESSTATKENATEQIKKVDSLIEEAKNSQSSLDNDLPNGSILQQRISEKILKKLEQTKMMLLQKAIVANDRRNEEQRNEERRDEAPQRDEAQRDETQANETQRNEEQRNEDQSQKPT